MSGARPNETIDALRRSVENSNQFPTETSYLEHQPDLTGEDAGITLPLVTIQPVSNIRLTGFNTDRVGYTTDSSGNRTGRVFNAQYRLNLQLDVWSAVQSSYDIESLGNTLWDVLYQHDSSGPDQPLPASDGTSLDGVSRVSLREGEAANDLSMTPSIRRWRMSLTVWGKHEFTTSESYVTSVSVPGDGDFDDLDDDGMISNVDDSTNSGW